MTGKNLSVTDGMKSHLQEKLVKLEKYSPRLIESHVVLKKEKYLFESEITLLAKNLRAYGKARSKENIYTAIDMAYVRVEKQLKKFREKVKDHAKGRNRTERSRLAASLQAEQAPRIVPSRSFAPKPMSLEEASLQLQLSPEPFLVFLNASNQKVNVIFKRQDGNHGWIEPSF